MYSAIPHYGLLCPLYWGGGGGGHCTTLKWQKQAFPRASVFETFPNSKNYRSIQNFRHSEYKIKESENHTLFNNFKLGKKFEHQHN